MNRRTLTLDKRTGKYYARIQVGGVLKKFYFGKNRRKAEQELRQLESEVAEGNKSIAAIANPQVDRATPSDITI
jgi:integrase